MDLGLAKGTRDLFPADKILRDTILRTLIDTFQTYGFNPLDTPIIERLDVLQRKAMANDDVAKEQFTLTDQGNRQLGLRFDLTVPFARFIGMNSKTLKLPFKRYQIGEIFRDGPIKLGRYRQFTQCDADICGVADPIADAELLQLLQTAFKKLKLDVTIKLNNRKLVDALLDTVGIQQGKRNDVMLALDKIVKYGIDVVYKELQDKGIGDATIQRLFEIVLVKGTNENKIAFLATQLQNTEGLEEIKRILTLTPGITFDISLMRGLSYYTGPIFEVTLNDSRLTSSLAGGGRYDTLIGEFIGGETIPATGISFGLDTICDAFTIQGKAPGTQSVCQVYIIPIKTLERSFEIASILRKKEIAADIDLLGKGISKNLDYANKLGIPYVLIIGKQELDQGKVKLRDMKSGKEQLLTVEEVCEALSAHSS